MEYKAGFVDFLEGLFTFLFVIFVILWLLRLSLPFLVKYFAKKMQKRFFGEFEKFQQQQRTFYQEETEIQSKEKRPQSKKVVGEYIDFEEI